MRAIDLVIVIGWVVFWAYWLIAARGVKSGRSGGWNRFIGLRVALLVVVIFAVRSWGLRGHQAGTDPVLTVIGLALFLLGLALAVWARLYIGRNWGAPMSHKDEPELVTTGPYRLIRHPIYTGLLMATIGTAIALGRWQGLISVAIILTAHIRKAKKEEELMLANFGETYQDYRRHTGFLIPRF